MECEIAKIYEATERTARKPYQCRECGGQIAKGERYLNCSGLWDWGYETHKQHLVCADACMLIRDKIENECIPFGYLMEWYGEHKYDLRESRLAPGVPEFRQLMAKVLNRKLQESRHAHR